ncbi:MAG: hypothetical protein KME49_04930 [Brasilonema octagenarum HA4186-MV1]|jgi:hypothetical protein|uniref:Uncharacterized protein n=1 Tax=Brasilonema octagenarum UFV-OR1 TaxID=417115 RepID=A0ABX1MC46_9CYAN|nr:hypothetical protein [Brasilonema octagenarum]MBW4624855.1 hypothetical protein [Brasilonema octagenarum HA4186-MV1]NMF66108.1 hypothetical protein [Brasilonema octagenarum UFV-OR1]
MPPVTPGSLSDSGLNLTLFTIPQSLLLQVGTASILLLQIAEISTTETLQAFGEATVELFRGDRLPILNFPDEKES